MNPRPTKSEEKDDWQHPTPHPTKTLSHNTPTLRLQELNKTNQRTICMKYTEMPLTDT